MHYKWEKKKDLALEESKKAQGTRGRCGRMLGKLEEVEEVLEFSQGHGGTSTRSRTDGV